MHALVLEAGVFHVAKPASVIDCEAICGVCRDGSQFGEFERS